MRMYVCVCVCVCVFVYVCVCVCVFVLAYVTSLEIVEMHINLTELMSNNLQELSIEIAQFRNSAVMELGKSVQVVCLDRNI